MAIARPKVTAQGHIPVPARMRRTLGVGPGSVFEWDEDGDEVVVRRAGRYSSEEMLLNHEHLTLHDAHAAAAAVARFRKRPALGFANCLLLEVARKAGHLPVGSFDRPFGKLPGVGRL